MEHYKGIHKFTKKVISHYSSFTGVQAVLELFFTQFVYVCSSARRAKTLSTILVNIFMALSKFCAITGGLLADSVLGNYHTQNISNILATVGLTLVVLSSWQYTINLPTCCITNSTSQNCTELLKHQFFSSWRISLSSPVIISFIIIGLMVRSYW